MHEKSYKFLEEPCAAIEHAQLAHFKLAAAFYFENWKVS